MSPFRTKEFKSLHEAWMQALEEDGFRDIEDTTLERDRLKTWDSHYFIRRYHDDPESYRQRQEYFEVATSLLNKHQFTDELQKRIWSLHCQGFYMREIARMLRTKKNRINKDKVNQVVLALQAVMGVG